MPNLVASFSAGADRNNFSGYVGLRFVPTVSIPVTALGARMATGNTGTRSVGIYAGATLICSATVTLGGSVGAFYYAAASATLSAGTTYDLVVQETSGGPMWADYGAVVLNSAGSAVSIYGSPGGFAQWAGGTMYAGVDLQYSVPPLNALKQPQTLPRLIAQYADPVDPDFDTQSLLTLNRRFSAMTNPPAPPPGIQAPTPPWPRELWAAWNEVDPDLDTQHPMTLSRRRKAATIQPQAVLRVAQAVLEVVAANPNPPMQVSQLLMEVVFLAPGQQVGAPPRAWRLRQFWPEFEDEPGPRQRSLAPGIADAPTTPTPTPTPTPTFFNFAVSVIT